MPLLTCQQLELINRRTLGYPLAVAEKDYFLALALQVLYESPLKDKLVFKGGTAIHHCYLPQQRFSEDLDFTARTVEITADEVCNVLVASQLFTIKSLYTSTATIKIERLRYAGILGQPGSIKVEIDHVQNIVLPPQPIAYSNVWHVPVTPQVMDRREVCAEKIRAASQRARYRDFYDLYLLLASFAPSLEEVIALLRQKEIRKPVRKALMMDNWRIASEQQATDRQTIYYAHKVSNEQIEAMLEQLTFADIENSDI